MISLPNPSGVALFSLVFSFWALKDGGFLFFARAFVLFLGQESYGVSSSFYHSKHGFYG